MWAWIDNILFAIPGISLFREFYVLIILIIAFIYLIYSFISVPLFLINLTIIILVAIAVGKELKERKKHIYYLIAAFLTALFFIFRDYGFLTKFSQIMKQHYILEYTYAIIVLFIFAQLVQFIHEYYEKLKKDIKQRKEQK